MVSGEVVDGVSPSDLREWSVRLQPLLQIEGGAAWQVEVRIATDQENHGVRPGDVTPGSGDPVKGTSLFDKVIWLTVKLSGGRIHLAGREWDAATKVWGPQRFQTAASRRVPLALARLTMRVFCPLVRLDLPDKSNISGRVRAARLVTSEHSPLLINQADALLPAIRHTSARPYRRNKLAQLLTWTVLGSCAKSERATTSLPDSLCPTSSRFRLVVHRDCKDSPCELTRFSDQPS